MVGTMCAGMIGLPQLVEDVADVRRSRRLRTARAVAALAPPLALVTFVVALPSSGPRTGALVAGSAALVVVLLSSITAAISGARDWGAILAYLATLFALAAIETALIVGGLLWALFTGFAPWRALPLGGDGVWIVVVVLLGLLAPFGCAYLALRLQRLVSRVCGARPRSDGLRGRRSRRRFPTR